MGSINLASPATGPIHQTALWPNSDKGIFVIISVASTVTVLVALTVIVVSVYAGAVKVLACQSSKKKPIVFAVAGSFPGVMVESGTVPPPPGSTGGVGVAGIFLQEKNITIKKKADVFKIGSLLNIIFKI